MTQLRWLSSDSVEDLKLVSQCKITPGVNFVINYVISKLPAAIVRPEL